MLQPVQAMEQLGKLQSNKHAKARLTRLMKLPKEIATIGMGRHGLYPDGSAPKQYDDANMLRRVAAKVLAELPDARARVLKAEFPTFHKEIEAGWQLQLTLPYTVSYNRRAYRAPGRPELYVSKQNDYLNYVISALEDYPDDVLTTEWVASWAVHLGYQGVYLGYLLAAQVDQGGETGETTLTILQDSAANRHAIGGPGRHAIRGLLCCSNPEAWEFGAKLLIAAQRQEGLRQTILESVDEAHPQAFLRMIDVVLEQKLIRFASVARAVGVWLGEEQQVENPKRLQAALETVRDLLRDPAARTHAITKGDAATAYRGLWAVATEDVEKAFKASQPLFQDKNAGRRFAAAKFALETNLPEVSVPMLGLIEDPDPAVQGMGLHYSSIVSNWGDGTTNEVKIPKDLFERLEAQLLNLPKQPRELKPPVEGWQVFSHSQTSVADQLVQHRGKRPPERLLPYLPLMSQYQRVQALGWLCLPRTLSSQVRQTLLAFAGEPNDYVREAAMGHLKKLKLAEDEVQTLEGYLSRKKADFRRSVFEILLTRTDKLMNLSIDRLLAAGDANSRAGGIELCRRMVDDERGTELVREKLRDYRESKGKRLPAAEADAIETILNPAALPPTLDDGLGTFDPAECTPRTPPKATKGLKFSTPATYAFLRGLDELIHEHRGTTFTYSHRDDAPPTEAVLGSIEYRWAFPSYDARKTREENLERLPLRKLWEKWLKDRPSKTRDGDGLEMVRASVVSLERIREGQEGNDFDDDDDDDENEKTQEPKEVLAAKKAIRSKPARVKYDGLIESLLGWFLELYPPEKRVEFIFNAAETALAMVPAAAFERLPTQEYDDAEAANTLTERREFDEWREPSWRGANAFVSWLYKAKETVAPEKTITPHTVRLFKLFHWLDQPVEGVRRFRPDLDLVLNAYAKEEANLADFHDHLIGPRQTQRWGSNFRSLNNVNGGSYDEFVRKRFPELGQAADGVVARIIDLELTRGETPTAATRPATDIARAGGLDVLVRLLAALGKNGFSRSSRYGTVLNKPAVLTILAQRTQPGPEDSPEAFAKAMKAAVAAGQFPLERVVELGLANPRWVEHVAFTVGWKGYEEAVYWLMAHSDSNRGEELGGAEEAEVEEKPEGGAEAKEKESKWQMIVRMRTDLTPEQRRDGLIDVAWFHKAYAAVGSAKRWDAIEESAKFLGYGQSHKKAARLADVLLGRMKKKELVTAIRTKFTKESVKLLGLLPLPTDAAKRDAELADRYKVLKDYERYARGLSSMSKEPAMQAARLGMENLAVTAGFGDPIRLEWAVTANEVADLGERPASVSVRNVTVSLRLNAEAEPEVSYAREGKPIDSLPADVRKHESVAELLERKKNLVRASSNTKKSLEQAMCAGDRFTAAELKSLMSHALVRPLLDRLVLKTDSGLGYPVKGGTALMGHDGKTIPVKAAERWSIAHPLDLLDAGTWHDWQAECFKAERLQPFKQVFREVYVPTAAEVEDHDKSRRYSGHQVNETQAKALFAGRGWSTRDEICKLYRDADLIVSVEFDHGYSTPADAAAPAIREAVFHRRTDWKRLPLKDVPKTIFSEVMRDLDLVVSVAHLGGVDPEASQSTIEMRADLVRETCRLLKLANVKLDSRHALIQGEYGRYSVHLGSGVVHKQPGGSLCVVPVEAQHRGRLFLPFADNDPRTAEMVSKVLLLSRDKEIQDPTILEQIASR